MLYKALKSFSGAISMAKNSVRDINDQAVINDLMRAGYIEPVAQEAEIVEKPAKKAVKPAEKKSK